MASTMKIGFVGAGKMARALAKGFLTAGLTKGNDIIASSPPQDEHLLKEFEALGAQITVHNSLVPQKSDVVILAVKPQIIPAVLEDIRDSVTTRNLIMSIAGGVTIQSIEAGLSAGSRVVRAMPNTPAQVRCGAAVFACGRAATEEDAQVAHTLLRAVGTCDLVPEHLMDAITALSSCGPAYVYMAIEAMADGGVKMGLPRDLAYRLATQTVIGAGRMTAETGQHPGQLKDDVTSPGGCTAAAIHYLENFRFRASLIGAVEQATLHITSVSSNRRS